MNEDMLCTRLHVYLLESGDSYFVGLTDHMFKILGDIMSIDLPEIGTYFDKDEVFATVDSVKGATELYMPVSGKVVEVNESLVNNVDLFTEQTEEESWLIRIETDADSLDPSDFLEYIDYKEEFD